MQRVFLPAIVIIVLSAMIAFLIGFLVSREERTYKYSIHSGEQMFRTLSYTKGEDGCITFKQLFYCDDEETVVLCGTYTIIENKEYDPHSL